MNRFSRALARALFWRIPFLVTFLLFLPLVTVAQTAIARFTDNGDGTVTDDDSGLVWLLDADCFGQVTWSAASSAADTLASGQYGLDDGSVPIDGRALYDSTVIP